MKNPNATYSELSDELELIAAKKDLYELMIIEFMYSDIEIAKFFQSLARKCHNAMFPVPRCDNYSLFPPVNMN